MADDIVIDLRKAIASTDYSDGLCDIFGDAADEVERLRAAGDALAVAYRTLGGLDVAHDAPLCAWEARRG